ncbi:RDD family protein [Shewanella sp. OPT22]|nr:RDD family protein [Shewanella sp. OPT22]
MDHKIDFSSYSLEDLYSSAQSIDRDAYPERAKEIDELILKKENEEPELQNINKVVGDKASRTDRFLAALIDGAIGILSILPLFLFIDFAQLLAPSVMMMGTLFLYGIVATLVIHGYLMMNFGQTIGKHCVSIRVENLDGSRASFNTIFFKRFFVMRCIGLIPGVGYLISSLVDPLFIFGKEHRCLHDHIAKTKVSYISDEVETKS